MSEVRVILDTNFLLIPGSHGVDIFDDLDRVLNQDYKIIIPSAVIRELKYLMSEGTSSERSAARLALEMASEGEIAEVGGPADDEILKLAKKGRSAVGTNDADLRKRLRAEGIPTIYLRQKSHLAVNGKI
ncbi:hypothetical protein AKJ43_03295 [candidate division MSBL1 archaeon SCGC-AAA261D19]|uniref:PIN domain-containing protein n=1 Tax=candidate division MSBL1 archaeon SCGC-AAA261D19 TaxID=1698273 RepID=A0A133V567_9EURY|nr:hypothetical protein AKJ43_03295 [candidate division MSBL1 archaeon SCGC-AAA261D19]